MEDSNIFSGLGETFLNLVSKFGPGQALFAFVFLIVALVFRKEIPNALKYLFDFFIKRKSKSKKPKANNHDIFTLIDETLTISETSRVRGVSVKTVMFKDSIYIYLTKTKTLLKELVERDEVYSMSDLDLSQEIDTVLNNISKEFNKDYRFKLKSQGLTQSDISFILSYLSPNRIRIKEIVKKRCHSIFISNYYPENQDKLVGFLEIMAFTVEDLIPTSLSAFEDMNGRFDKYSWDKDLEKYSQK